MSKEFKYEIICIGGYVCDSTVIDTPWENNKFLDKAKLINRGHLPKILDSV